MPRARVAGLVWDRSGETQARDSLRHALYEIEKSGSCRLEADHDTIRLDVSGCWVDAFESPARAELLLDSLYGTSASFDQWLQEERVRFERRWQTVLEREADVLVARNAAPELRAAAGRKLLNFLPTHEPAVRMLMTAFADMGDRAQAIREYERFRMTMSASLSAAPSEQTAALYGTLRLKSPVTARYAASLPEERGLDRAEPSARPPVDPTRVAPPSTAPVRAQQPSIAVLPFKNLSTEPGHDRVAEGLAEDFTEGVSRVPDFFVVSRLSAAAFKDQNRSPQEIGEALGVRYLLSGSTRFAGDRLRLVVELTETESGRALWVARFDRKSADLLDLENDLAETAVLAIAPHLRSAELRRVHIKRPEDQTAYDLLLRAQENMNNPARPVFESAGRLFELAIRREPRYANALAWRAYWHVMRVGQGWSPDPAADTKRACDFAERAVACDHLEPMGFAVQGHVSAYLHKDFDRAFACFETAVRLNPNGARAWMWSASAHAWTGDGPRAIEKINRAMALSPYDPLMYAYSGSAAMAYMADSQYPRAIEFALRCIGENRGYTGPYKLLIAALALSGRRKEAKAPLHQLLQLEPDFTVQQFRRRFPGSAWPIADQLCDALATAGVPLSD